MRDLIWFEGVYAFTLLGGGGEGLRFDGAVGDSLLCAVFRDY